MDHLLFQVAPGMYKEEKMTWDTYVYILSHCAYNSMIQDTTRSPFVFVNTPSSPHMSSICRNDYQQQQSFSRLASIPQRRRNMATRSSGSAIAFKYQDDVTVHLASFAPVQFPTLKDNATAHEFSLAYEQHCQEILDYIKTNQVDEASIENDDTTYMNPICTHLL